MSEGFHYVVRLTVASRACFDWLPAFLEDFWRDHPEIDVDITIGLTAPLPTALGGHEIDVAVIVGAAPLQVDATPLFDDTVVAVTAPDYPLAAQAAIGPEAFARHAFVTDEASPSTDPWLREVLEPAGVSPLRLIASGSPEATAALIAAHAGIGLSGASRALRFQKAGRTICRPLGAKGVRTRWHVVVRADEGDATPTAFVADRMSYWCQARQAELGGDPAAIQG